MIYKIKNYTFIEKIDFIIKATIKKVNLLSAYEKNWHAFTAAQKIIMCWGKSLCENWLLCPIKDYWWKEK